MDNLTDQQLEDAVTKRQLQRLIQVQIFGRWVVNVSLWLTVGIASLWGLQQDIALWLEFFTWAAVRSSLQGNRLAFLGLGLCVSMTLSTLIWQSWHILWGISKAEDRELRLELQEILAIGESHPLWRWVIAEKV
jgi:hypothetical protein